MASVVLERLNRRGIRSSIVPARVSHRQSRQPLRKEPRRLAEKALTAVMQEAYLHRVSTRSVDDLAMGMTGISKSQVSRLRAEIDEKVQAFLKPADRR